MHRLFCNGDAFDMGNTNGKFGDNSSLISFLRHFYKPNSSSWIFLLGSYNLTDWASCLKWFYDDICTAICNTVDNNRCSVTDVEFEAWYSSYNAINVDDIINELDTKVS